MSTHHPAADGPQDFRFDRRFWVRWYLAAAALALVTFALADDALSRALSAFVCLAMGYQAWEKARALRRHGRWIAPLDEARAAAYRRHQLRLAVLIGAAFVAALAIGLTTGP